jgi:hypothetical protein
MVENFVEKYIPVRIQSQISETLQQVLPYKETQTLAAFEKLRFNEMHQLILEDDGVPRLYEKIKDIRFDMEHMDFDNYQGMRLARTRTQVEEQSSVPSRGGTMPFVTGTEGTPALSEDPSGPLTSAVATPKRRVLAASWAE